MEKRRLIKRMTLANWIYVDYGDDKNKAVYKRWRRLSEFRKWCLKECERALNRKITRKEERTLNFNLYCDCALMLKILKSIDSNIKGFYVPYIEVKPSREEEPQEIIRTENKEVWVLPNGKRIKK